VKRKLFRLGSAFKQLFSLPIKHPGAHFDDGFNLTADDAMFECNVTQAIVLSSAVSEQLSVWN
jgi:hypothetical protein